MKGWESSEVELKENSKRQLSAFRRKLQDGGYSEVEANHIIARHPSVREARWLPTAGLIFDLSLPLTEEYDDVVSIATEFDRLCFAIKDAYDSEEILRVQSSLIDASKWLLSYCPEDLRAEKISEFEYKIRGTSDLDALNVELHPKLTHWGCGGFLGLVVVHVHAARPKPPRYSSGLWPPKDSLTLFRLYHWI